MKKAHKNWTTCRCKQKGVQCMVHNPPFPMNELKQEAMIDEATEYVGERFGHAIRKLGEDNELKLKAMQDEAEASAELVLKDFELKHCETCNQMTNFLRGKCQKHNRFGNDKNITQHNIDKPANDTCVRCGHVRREHDALGCIEFVSSESIPKTDHDYIAFVYSQGFRDGQESVIQIIEEMRYPEEHLGTANIKPTEMYERGFNSAISQIQNKLK